MTNGLNNVTVAAVQLWSSKRHSPDQNRTHALEMAARAAQHAPDLVVLPEAVSMLCFPDDRRHFTYRDVSEPVPGPTTDRFAAIAALYEVNMVVGLIAHRGSDQPCQNLAVVLDRSGTIVGTYEKVHEPAICRTEQDAGTGSEIPVFELDFGRIGIFVCWDIISPELTSILALKGAQMLCFPHLIALPTPANLAVLLRARAIDAGLPVVAAGMRDAHNHNGSQDGVYPTCIIDADGNVVTQSTTAGADVVIASLSLASDTPNRNHIRRRRPDLRPELYAEAYGMLSRQARRGGR